MSDSPLNTPSHYYPYGMLFGESSCDILSEGNPWMGSGQIGVVQYGQYGNGIKSRSSNNYKYGGKEHLTFRGVYQNDFGTRLQDPALCMFTTPDIMCEKHPHVTPYLYCSADPINKVDPSGMDEYLINADGYVTEIVKNKQCDEIIISVGDSKNVVEFRHGTIRKFNSSFSGKKGYYVFEIRGDDNGTGELTGWQVHYRADIWSILWRFVEIV